MVTQVAPKYLHNAIGFRILILLSRYMFVCDEWLSIDFEDGQLERKLRVSTMNTEVHSGLLLRHSMNRKLFNDHLWLSVYFKSPMSSFSRSQRLSVCVSLLYLTMITNAMWYETSANSSSGIFSFGPITFSVTELINSVWSNLIAIPPITLITSIFANHTSKKQNKDDRPFADDENKEKTDDSSWKPPTKRFQFPHWCLYMAWVLVALSILVSGFFIILYSLDWGGDVTNAWLTAFFLSFFESIVIIQPAKV